MYLYKAIDRINKIDWTQSVLPTNEQADYWGYEYLRRMAGFIKEYEMNP